MDQLQFENLSESQKAYAREKTHTRNAVLNELLPEAHSSWIYFRTIPTGAVKSKATW